MPESIQGVPKKKSPTSKLDFILENDFVLINRITGQNYKSIKNMNAFLTGIKCPLISTFLPLNA